MSNYRALRVVTRFGTAISLASGILIPALTAWMMLGTEWSWRYLFVSALAGIFVGFFIKVVAELVQVIVEMLLPQ